MKTYMRMLALFPAAMLALTLVMAPLVGWASHDIEFEEAHIFFELNDTDGDLGIHGKIDGGPWTSLRIATPNERLLMRLKARGRLYFQELTELFFESAEPIFDELSPESFFRRFPEGIYAVFGWSRNIGTFGSETEVTHTMPAPPEPTVNLLPMAEQCDDEEEGFDITMTSAPVTIAWPAVTMSHPDLGTQPPVPVEIVNYQLVVEAELEVDGEEFETVLSKIVPPGVTSMTLPEEFLAQTDKWKYEVLAREASFNQTAVESCFMLK